MIESDYFTEHFYVMENKMEMRKYSSVHFSFTLLRIKIRVWVKVGFGVSYRVRVCFGSELTKKLINFW